MQNINFNIELKRDTYSRAIGSSIGHIILVCVFLGISKNYLVFFKDCLYINLCILAFNILRIVFTKIYFSKAHNNFSAICIDLTTVATAILWGSLFTIVYLKLGLYQAPTIALYIICAGIASAAASSLFAQRSLLVIFLIFTIAVPGSVMIYNEIILSEKIFGVLIFTFFGFLISQSKVNRKNLIARLELANYLSEEAKRVEQLFNSVPGIFCYFHNDGQILASNQMWKDFSKEFGNKVDFAYGMDPIFVKKIDDFKMSKDEVMSFEFQLTKNKDSLWYICTVQKVSSSNALLLFMVDISSLRIIQEELKLKDAHYQHSARLIELGEMVGAIAHEINNPLTVVSGRAQVSLRMVRSNNLDYGKLTSHLELIETSAGRISKLVNGMKSLVRNSENDPPTNQSLESHLEIVRFLALNKAEMRKVKIDFENFTNDFFVLCRPSQIEQVLINLINNAIDAAETTDEKWVKVNIHSNAHYLIFEVVDSGKGISEEVLKKIWNPFFTTKEVGKGTGLGLSISLSIILENNGLMYYKDKAENTTFVIEIPKARSAA